MEPSQDNRSLWGEYLAGLNNPNYPVKDVLDFMRKYLFNPLGQDAHEKYARLRATGLGYGEPVGSTTEEFNLLKQRVNNPMYNIYKDRP